ncbi:MAG: DUF3883 domain-containing protein [Clostridia bacterium]|nr:DUF3883 domain-containing protein [Clostridia bacterium]
MNNPMKEYIDIEIKKRQEIYRISTSQIKSDFAREKADIEAYNGRQLLELIQNADDEAIDNLPKHILISFENNVLSISNYGEPFSEEGIESLMYSNTSSKRDRKKDLIGNKGTGFRSILSWADYVTINSGDLHVRFSDEHSQRKLVSTFESVGRTLPSNVCSATLAFPEWLEDCSAQGDFTTTVSIKVKDNTDIAEDIKKQIEALDENLLLFLNRTEQVDIDMPEMRIRYSKTTEGDRVQLRKSVNGSIISDRTWTLNRCEGYVADDNDESKQKSYNVVVAYCSEGIAQTEQHVYSYFRTNVDFPYPKFLIHASFLLDQSRNHLIKSKTNETILRAAAKLLVETATAVGRQKTSNYDIIDLLIAQRTLATDIKNFDTYIVEAARDASIFPNVNGKYISFTDDTKWYNNGLAKCLRGKGFEQCLLHVEEGSDRENFIKSVADDDWRIYDYEYISKILSKQLARQDGTDFTTDNGKEIVRNRVKLAFAFYNQYRWSIYYNKAICPGFFVNTAGKTIPYNPDNPAFLLEEDMEIETLPGFINFEIIHPYMRDFLIKYINRDNVNTFDDVEDLSRFNIKKFNLERITEHIRTSFDTIIKTSKPSQAKTKWKRMIAWFWNNQGSFIDKKIRTTFPFLTKKGEFVISSKLYYGKEYGNDLCERLFEKHPELLISDIKDILPTGIDAKSIIRFLGIFGVAALPRIYINKHWRHNRFREEYIKRVLEKLHFPLPVGKDRFKSLDDLLYRLTSIAIYRYEIDELTIILNECSTETIIEWILSDSKLREILSTKKDVVAVKDAVQILWDRKREPVTLPELTEPYSYLYDCFITTPWIEANGQRYLPGNCMLDLESDCDLSPILVSPNVSDYIKNVKGNPRDQKKKYSSVLQSMGVKKGYGEGGFPELPLDTIYSVLMLLPDKENSERIAARMYEAFVTSNETYSEIDQCKERGRFFAEGKVLCDDGYYPVSEARYLPEKNVSRRILESCNVLSVPSRRSAKVVEKYLGVKRLEVHEELYGTPVVHPENDQFSLEYRRFVPLAFAYRLADIKADSDVKDEARKISNISITICSELRSSFDGSVYELYDYEFITGENHDVYLKVPEDFSVSRNMGHNLALASAIANILCSNLDISSSLSKFRELFNLGNNKDREELLLQDIESRSIIVRAKEALDFSEDLQEEFVRIVSTITGRDCSAEKSVADALDFDDFSSIANARSIIRLFKTLGVDVSDYNAEIPSERINLCPYYEEEVDRRKARLEDQYKVSCFRRLEKGSLQDKKTLVKALTGFRSIRIPVENTVYFDMDEAIEKALGINFEAEPVNLVSLYNANLDAWESKLEDKSALEEFLTEQENVSLVYYGEFGELNKRYSELLKSHVKEEAPIEEPQNQTIRMLTGVPITAAPLSASSSSGGRKVGFIKKESSKENERTGLKGEQLVYDELKKSGEYERVNWLSENAKKAKVCPEGKAGLGYDFEVFDKDGNRFLIEVKASKTSVFEGIRFQLSDNEYRTAMDNPNSYRIYYVGNVFDAEPEIIILDNFIVDGEISDSFSVLCKKEFSITAELATSAK